MKQPDTSKKTPEPKGTPAGRNAEREVPTIVTMGIVDTSFFLAPRKSKTPKKPPKQK